jgi:hypothetical protein
MNEFVINVVPDPSIVIDISSLDQAVSLDISQNQPNSITIEDDVNNVLLNPTVFYNGINIVYLSGVSGELLHNTFGDLQGGTTGQYYHLTSGQYFNLTTGLVVRPSETGVFYPRSNPSGYITGVDLSNYSTIPFSTGISGYLQNQVTNLNNQTGSYYPRNNPSGYITGVNLSGYVTGDVIRPSDTGAFYPVTNPSGYITGVDLSSYATIGFVTGISGYLQPQITNLNNQTGSYVTGSVVRPSETGAFITQSQTGQFYAASNPSGFITGVDLSAYITGINNIVYTTGNQDISGLKDFQTRPTVLDIPVLVSGDAVDTIHLYGKNDQGTAIYKGQPVYIYSANGANPLIQLASNTGERTSSKTIGLLAQDLSVNAFGYIITEGLLEGFNTSAGAAGDPMWLGPTGNIIYGTGNKPYGNNHLVSLGIVLRSNNNNGKVYVKVQNGFEIEELHQVYAINPSNKDTLLYNSGSGAWFARQLNTGDVSGINNYYLGSNPSGYITGINNIVYTTGDQAVNGVKNFLTQPTISGNSIATVSDPVRTTVMGNGVVSGFAISGASGLINPSALIVAIDGILQEPVVDYTLSASNITFTSPLPSGSKAVVISPTNTLQVSNMIPADGSVTSAKLDNSINFATRPTTSDTSALSATSLITRADGDVRYQLSDLRVNQYDVSSFRNTTAVGGAAVSTAFGQSNGFFLSIPATSGANIFANHLSTHLNASATNTAGLRFNFPFAIIVPILFIESNANTRIWFRFGSPSAFIPTPSELPNIVSCGVVFETITTTITEFRAYSYSNGVLSYGSLITAIGQFGTNRFPANLIMTSTGSQFSARLAFLDGTFSNQSTLTTPSETAPYFPILAIGGWNTGGVTGGALRLAGSIKTAPFEYKF